MTYIICKDTSVIKYIITSLLVSDIPFLYFDDGLNPIVASDPKFADIAMAPILSLIHPSHTVELNQELVILSKYTSESIVLHPDFETIAINVINKSRINMALNLDHDSIVEGAITCHTIDVGSVSSDIDELIKIIKPSLGNKTTSVTKEIPNDGI